MKERRSSRTGLLRYFFLMKMMNEVGAALFLFHIACVFCFLVSVFRFLEELGSIFVLRFLNRSIFHVVSMYSNWIHLIYINFGA